MTKPERRFYRFRFGTAVYDELRQTLEIDGQPSPIPPRQRGLLSALLRADGVVERDDLLDQLWGKDLSVPSHNVDSAIERLRRCLGPNAFMVATVHGCGYRFDGLVQVEELAREAPSGMELEAGQSVPGRGDHVLISLLSRSPESEVWLAMPRGSSQDDLPNARVFKFTQSRTRLREFKREYRIAMLAREQLGKRHDLACPLSLQVQQTPYWLEFEYGGESLDLWAATGKLLSMPRATRLSMWLDIARAVFALHGIPIWHGDLKPGNVLTGLTARSGDEMPSIQLIDFGSAAQVDIGTMIAMTDYSARLDGEPAGSARGTFEYMAPERLSAGPPSAPSDLYSLGVMLFKLAVGDLDRRMGTDWREQLGDEFLAEEVAACTRSDPAQRASEVGELIERIETLEARRSERARQAEILHRAESARAALAVARRRLRTALAISAALSVGIVASGYFANRAHQARLDAEAAAAQARTTLQFLDEDVLGMADPFSSSPLTAVMREPLMRAVQRADKLQDRPQVELAVRSTLAGLLTKYQLAPQAEAQWRRVAELATSLNGPGDPVALRARYRAAGQMSLTTKPDSVQEWLAATDMDAETLLPNDTLTRVTGLSARAQVSINQQRPDLAAPQLEAALRLARDHEGQVDQPQMDVMRRNLVMAYIVTARYGDAVRIGRDLVNSLESRPGVGPLAIALAKLTLGQAHLYGGDLSEASALIEPAEELITANLGETSAAGVTARNSRCEIYTRAHQFVRATDCSMGLYRALLASKSVPPWQAWAVLGNVGILELLDGNHKKALEDLNTALGHLSGDLGPKSGLVHLFTYYAAEAQWRLGHAHLVAPMLTTLDPTALASAEPDAPWAARLDLLGGLASAAMGHKIHAVEQLTRATKELADHTIREPEHLQPLAAAALDRLQGTAK